MARTLSLITVVLSCLVCPSLARADAADLAQECIQAIQSTVQTTRERIRDVADAGIDRLGRLDDGGATDRELRQSAALTVRHINSVAETGQRRIARLSHACIEALIDMDARPALINAVRDAAQNGHQAISTAADRAREAVHAALEAALND